MENRLKEIRQRNSLTLEKMGEKVGIAKNTLSRYESGKREPKLEVWQKLADFFKVSVPYLQGFDEHKSNRLKELRQHENISQGDLAKATGLTRQAISNYERGNRDPSRETWQQLANYFEVSVPYLKGEIDTEYLEKLVELLMLISFPNVALKYRNNELDDSYRPFLAIAITSQISKLLGYDSKEKFQEIYDQAIKLIDNPENINELRKYKGQLIELLTKSKDITNNLLQTYNNL